MQRCVSAPSGQFASPPSRESQFASPPSRERTGSRGASRGSGRGGGVSRGASRGTTDSFGLGPTSRGPSRGACSHQSSIDDWGWTTSLDSCLSVDLSTVDRNDLPLGVSQVLADRMKLDARMAPAVLDLRMNYRNLMNEMIQHKGKIVSHQFSLMQPRPRCQDKPGDLIPLPQHYDAHFLRRMARKKKIYDRKMAVAARREQQEQLANQAAALKTFVVPDQDLRGGEEADDIRNMKRDPTLATEVQRLKTEANVIAVHGSLLDPPMNSSGMLPASRIKRALVALGYHAPDAELIKSTIKTLARYDPENQEMDISLDEFCVVLSAFKKERDEMVARQFIALDDDGSGSISAREFKRLLWDLGYTVNHNHVVEFFNEVDQDKSGYVEKSEFEAALVLVHDRHGFTHTEAMEFYRLFDRYDGDNSGEIAADELASALGWFGTPTSIAQARAIIRHFDEDDDGTLTRPEFLLVMRARLEEEISDMRALFAAFDRDSTGTMTPNQLLELFLAMGYTIPKEVIEEGIREMRNGANSSQGLIFEDVLLLLQAIRKREGFSIKEVQELKEVHERFDGSKQGELREFEMARALNWLGYQLSHHRRRQLWCKVDVDKSNSIDVGEFNKCVRLLREEEIEAIKGHLAVERKSLEQNEFKGFLHRLGYVPDRKLLEQAMKMNADADGDGLVDVLGVLSVLTFIRESQVTNLRQSAGLPDRIAQKVRSKWNIRVEQGKKIEPADFERFLLNDLFKLGKVSGKIDPEQQANVQAILRENCKEGGMDLSEAFWVVRLYTDMREEDTWRREQEFAKEAGFSPAQVAQFRKAFVEADADGSGELSDSEILSVFDSMMALSMIQVHKLKSEITSLNNSKGKDTIDFPEFLRLMGIIVGNGLDATDTKEDEQFYESVL